MVSTHLKNISQIGSFPHLGVKIKNCLKPQPSWAFLWFDSCSLVKEYNQSWQVLQSENRQPKISPNASNQATANFFVVQKTNAFPNATPFFCAVSTSFAEVVFLSSRASPQKQQLWAGNVRCNQGTYAPLHPITYYLPKNIERIRSSISKENYRLPTIHQFFKMLVYEVPSWKIRGSLSSETRDIL